MKNSENNWLYVCSHSENNASDFKKIQRQSLKWEERKFFEDNFPFFISLVWLESISTLTEPSPILWDNYAILIARYRVTQQMWFSFFFLRNEKEKNFGDWVLCKKLGLPLAYSLTFMSLISFCNPWKHKNLWFSVFKGCRMKPWTWSGIMELWYGSRYSRMDQVKSVEDSF